MLRFQEFDTDDEKNGVLLDRGSQHDSGATTINPDELYFNDMDIRAWERRTSALQGTGYSPMHGHQEEDEGYYDDTGESITHAEYEEMMFQRVLDKIRIARAAGNEHVELTPEEIDSYQAKLYGNPAPAARPQPESPSNDSAVYGATTGRSGHPPSTTPRAKKSQRSSFFSSKPKKEKPSSRKRSSTMSSASSHVPPGFIVPGPDGQPLYAPINAYQGSLARDVAPPSRTVPREALGTSHQTSTPPRDVFPGDIVGAFPGSEHAYPSATPPWQGPSAPSRQPLHGQDYPSASRTHSESIQPPRMMPFPIEPYQYHNFSPTSASPTSPQFQYTRSVSSGPSEASFTTMPRRVPVPAPAPIPVQRTVPATTTQEVQPDPILATPGSSSRVVGAAIDAQGPARAGTNGKDGEKKRKVARKKKV